MYWKVDGGSDNANWYSFAVAELLIAKRIGIETLLFTRLPVGHTHEDIDAMFGNISNAIEVCSNILSFWRDLFLISKKKWLHP